MKASAAALVFLITYALTQSNAIAQVTLQERNALIALYNSTNGPNWVNNTGWLGAEGTECSWYGVMCDVTSHVIQLNLRSNQLSGNIPPEVGNLTYLHSISFGINQLSGSIPPEIGNLTNLGLLDLYSNQLSGSIPPEIGNLSNLTNIGLAFNQLSGNIPPEIGNLSNLYYLYFYSNQLSGNIPSEIGSLTNLRILWLDSNQLSGSIPSELGNLTNLQRLGLFSNQLSGSIPPELSSLDNMFELHLQDNQLSGNIPPELGNLANLQYARLDSNQLSGNIPPELSNLSNLLELQLQDNQLSGSIPPQLANLSNLQYLSLGINQLSGNIPPELGNLTNLEWLNLSSNQLSGTIPPELGNLSSLQVLWLYSNQLSGSIPSQLANLTNLISLFLYSNQLSGGIPSEFGNLTNLQYLRLNSNQLNGSIPLQLTNLSSLSIIQIGYNALYATDQALIDFLNTLQPDWQNTQTIAPTWLSAEPLSSTAILVSWTPIPYTADNGRYHIYRSTTSGGPYVPSGSTPDKLSSSFTATSLDPGTTYYFVILTVTDSHTYNQSTIWSDFSYQVSATTQNPVPAITSLSPSSTMAGGSSFTLTVNGSSFMAGSVVRWNGSDRATTYISVNQLTASITAVDIAAAGTASVTVFNPAPGGGTSNTLTFAINQSGNPTPVITSLSPSSTTVGGSGFTLTINGSSFVAGAVVQWNGSDRATTFMSANQLTAAITAADIATAGTAPVTVFNPAPGGGTSNTLIFSIYASPVITLAPDSLNFEYYIGSALPGAQTVSITSSGGSLEYGVTVETDLGGDWLSVSETVGTTPGSLGVAVNPLGLAAAAEAAYTGTVTVASAGAVNSPQTVQVNLMVRGYANPTPELTGISPTGAMAGGPGFNLQVYGRSLVRGTKVLWDGIEMGSVTFLSSRQLRVEVPEGFIQSAGQVGISAYTPEPGGGETNTATFTIASPEPVMTGLSLQSVIAGRSGYDVGIYGGNFLPESVAEWNGSGRTTQFISSRQLVIQLGAADIATAGTGTITILNPGGGRSNGKTLEILDLPASAPEILRLTPDTIEAGTAGFTLRVEGSGFVTGSTVLWNGQEKTTQYESAGRLRAEIEADDIGSAEFYYVTVRNPEAAGLMRSNESGKAEDNTSNEGVESTRSGAPRVTGFTPASVAAGSEGFQLQITGWGYVAGKTEVSWNTIKLPSSYVNESELRVDIPASYVAQAYTAEIKVSNPSPGGGAQTKTFTVTENDVQRTALLYPRLMNVGGEPDESESTGIVMANLSEADTSLTAWAYGMTGVEIRGERITNPASWPVSPNEQQAIVDSEVFGASLRQENGEGWLKLESTENRVAGFFMIFNDSTTYMDGANALTEGLDEFVFTEIEGEGFTEFNAANPNAEAVTVRLRLWDENGQPKGSEVQRQISGHGLLKEQLTELFSGVEVLEGDYVYVISDGEVVPFEYMGKKPDFVYGLSGQAVAGGDTVMYAPQYVAGGGVYRTTISVVNLDATDGTVTLRLIGDDGIQIGDARVLGIKGRGKLQITDQSFFAETAEQVVTGYVVITSNGVRLAGNVVFGDPERKQFASSLPLVSELLREMVFGHVVTGEIYWTGIAVLNPGGTEADVTIRLYDEWGNLIRSRYVEIPAGRRTIGLLTEYFEGLSEEEFDRGYMRISADQGVASFALFGKGLTFLSAIPAQTVPAE